MIERHEGNLVGAAALARRAFRIWHTKLGTEHPNTRMARDWLSANDPEFDPNA